MSSMNRLIQDLLDVARLEAGRIVLERTDNDAVSIASEAVELSAARAAAKSLRLDIESSPALPLILVDRDRILRVFTNIIDNAISFSPPGGLVEVVATRVGGVPLELTTVADDEAVVHVGLEVRHYDGLDPDTAYAFDGIELRTLPDLGERLATVAAAASVGQRLRVVEVEVPSTSETSIRVIDIIAKSTDPTCGSGSTPTSGASSCPCRWSGSSSTTTRGS